MSKRIVTIVGARPQFVKAAALSREITKDSRIHETLVHTGQHFDKNMSEIFFEELEIPKPEYFLDIHGGNHGQMTGQMIAAIEEVLCKEKPDVVLVYGDTNSTLAGALAAAKLHIPIAHVEAGLRSFNKKMPEEINRILTDHLSDFLFCPTKESVKNLLREGITSEVFHVGDIMYDATLYAKTILNKKTEAFESRFKFQNSRFALMTVHRQESTDDDKNFSAIMDYADRFARKNNLTMLFPAHPRIKNLIKAYQKNPRFSFVEPFSYLETQYAISKAHSILTDSGGLQKEAYFHRIPCVTLRSETEWIETVEKGWNRLWTVEEYNPQKPIEDYGNGDGAQKIVQVLSTM